MPALRRCIKCHKLIKQADLVLITHKLAPKRRKRGDLINPPIPVHFRCMAGAFEPWLERILERRAMETPDDKS